MKKTFIVKFEWFHFEKQRSNRSMTRLYFTLAAVIYEPKNTELATVGPKIIFTAVDGSYYYDVTVMTSK